MKQYILLFLIVISVRGFAQHPWAEEHDGRLMNKIQELEKVKLLEYLDLDEETAIKFFVRRRDHRERLGNLEDEKRKVMEEVEQKLESEELDEDDPYYDAKIAELRGLHKQIANEFASFSDGLSDILTKEQQLKLIIFEQRFREEIRSLILGGRKHKHKMRKH